MLLAIFFAACVLFGLGYHFYGGFVERRLEVNKEEQTPAHTMRDGVDYDPAPELVLFGHHFSAIAGMEGALASVIGGMASCPVIAVPTSVGYGASFEGLSALLSMLNSCASGVSVVNIDNGFGAGYMASMINHVSTPGKE